MQCLKNAIDLGEINEKSFKNDLIAFHLSFPPSSVDDLKRKEK